MHKIIFKCQSITPMFLGGADGEPDLRPPSIKGAMRYWWRAMHGHLTIEKLKEKESHIFGNTEQRSKVILRCKTSERLREKQFTKGAGMGIDYLFYAMDMGANKRHYFDDINFEVILKSKDKGMLREAAYAFWLLANLGGIGSRSRRGGGSFVITGIETDSDLDFNFMSDAQDADAWVRDLKKGIEIIKHSTGIHSIQSKTRFNSFQNVGIYLVDESFDKAENALYFIGQKYKSFRESKKDDAHNIEQYIENNKPIKAIEKASFGLPISYKVGYRDIVAKPDSEDYNRSASSLLISIVQINGKYYPLLVNFNSKILPDNVKIKVAGTTVPHPNKTLKQDFIHSLNTI